MVKFFHRLLHPHCKDCDTESICESCETLKEQLAFERASNLNLLNRILELTAPVKPEPINTNIEQEPIKPRFIPNRIRKQMLETEDREAARAIREKTKEIEQASQIQRKITVNQPMTTEELEKELGVNNA